jgi:hypothetical protein
LGRNLQSLSNQQSTISNFRIRLTDNTGLDGAHDPFSRPPRSGD